MADLPPSGRGEQDIAERDPRPVVTLPRQGLPGAAIAALALLLAMLLFVALDAQRRRAGSSAARLDRSQGNAFPAPPPLAVPPEPAPAPPAVTVVTTPAPPAPMRVAPVAVPLPRTSPYEPVPFSAPLAPVIVPRSPEGPAPRRDVPALVIDGGEEQGPGTATRSSGQPAPGGAGATRAGANGAGTGGDDAPASATLIGNKTTVMPTGTLIPAVLETSIDTARPGLIRAVVSQDTRGFDGRRVLVPRGSRLIGEYQADVRSGQNRVLVTWTRLIRPDGAAIRLQSPAADSLGGAGVPGHVHSYFFQRFASAVLQSALTVGVNLASRPGNGSVIVGIPSAATNVVGQNLLPNDVRPKITVKQGAALNVFVARDLDFSGVPARGDGR